MARDKAINGGTKKVGAIVIDECRHVQIVVDCHLGVFISGFNGVVSGFHHSNGIFHNLIDISSINA